jgi:hypothetical protein
MPEAPSHPSAALADSGECLPLFPTWQARSGGNGEVDRHDESGEGTGKLPGSIVISGSGGPGPIATRGAAGRQENIFADYPGAKGGAGVWQTIINQLPPHEVWIEAFVGSGAVTRHKRPAPAANIVIDADPAVVAAWRAVPGISAVCADAVRWLAETRFGTNPARVVVYCDPPYLRAVRSCRRDYYHHEFASEAQHRALLTVLRQLPARVILSGYPSELYARELADWRTVTFQTVNRRGRKVTECLWLNFPEPFALHQYDCLGRNFRERERIKRKKARWHARLLRMPMLERAAILEAVAVLTAGNGERIPRSRLAGSAERRRRRPPELAMLDPIGVSDDASSGRAAAAPEPSPQVAGQALIAENGAAAASTGILHPASGVVFPQ